MMRMAIIAVALALGVAGCGTNPFEDNYASATDQEYAASVGGPGRRPILRRVHAGTHIAIADELRGDGYILLGGSEFIAHVADEDDAITWGHRLGADKVLLSSEYLASSSGTMPLTIANPPQYGTAKTSGGMIVGGEYMSYQSTTDMVLPGGYSTYNIPFTLHSFRFTATYWARRLEMPPASDGTLDPDQPRPTVFDRMAAQIQPERTPE